MSTELELERPAQPPSFQGISTGRKAKNLAATVMVSLCFVVAVIPLVWVLWTVASRGMESLLRADWWSHSLSGVRANEDLGGAYHAIYGTIAQGLVTAVIAVPIGILVGIYLVEYGAGTRFARVTTFTVDILTGVPSIVAALFVYSVWISIFGFSRSAFANCLALLLLMIPMVVRSTEEMLRVVPNELREASYALGIPKWKTIVKVVIPTALSGIVTGVMLGVARIMGETAPALILMAYSARINMDIFEGSMANLPLLMVKEFTNPEAAGFNRTWGAALTLILIIMLFNLAATLVSRLSAVKTK
ncbi:phosphate ABC transporter, permease protein PstA [Actinoalloteichus sp. AHMU CJ021]|uniref:Phosphate transport system permease protein PstA n=1 Tax=Actinoalloteichus caeruleus DSM 43889 TaxID=1120930 RepID=A0ABT1JL22_ACTCY|nr:phosphate ABC transporter permease PstA [Actinoalloteichus caeruleus]AUS78994.1 phosphate ABC transporter, permease protein PstA [Actinoalloteichus sp. AHMU CJ021]MCP2333218.1 phosphate ABC transporter membrane protein 2, PhoT family (TC 3.A.1.7.1) [Actinoalloteichus caeruleus DSM 43889]